MLVKVQVRPAFPEKVETARLLICAPREEDGAEVNAAIRLIKRSRAAIKK